MATYVIVGGGQAAGQACASLRQEKFGGDIVLIGEEDSLPYQRPPLSKQYLSGEMPRERLLLRAEKFYQDQNITTQMGTRVEAIDRAQQTVATNRNEHIHYDRLLLCTGSRARKLSIPGSDLPGIHYLRTVADVDAIRSQMLPGKKLVIVGGGYIGLEVASVAIKLGLQVTVVEMESRILQRVTTPEMSAFYHRLHEERGVHILTDTLVAGFEGNTALERVLCKDSDALNADIAIVGIGIIPNVEIAQEAGLDCDNGILVDEHCRTTDELIYAAGDCTNHPNPLLHRRLKLESVPNAMDQARVSAANMCGTGKTYAAIPWFWSDQYDLKLQMVGFSSDGDQQVIRGTEESHAFTVFYLKDGVVVAADSVNNPKEFMICKKLVAERVNVDPQKLADVSLDMKSLLG